MDPPVSKKARITDHFRVALKPQDVNAQRTFKKLKQQPDFGKENIEIITISDDEDENSNNTDVTNVKQLDVTRRPVLESKQQLRQEQQQQSLLQPHSLSQAKCQPQLIESQQLQLDAKLSEGTNRSSGIIGDDNDDDDAVTEEEDDLDVENFEGIEDENHVESTSSKGKATLTKPETELKQHRQDPTVKPLQQRQPNQKTIATRSITRHDASISASTSPLNKYTSPPGKHPDVFDHDKTLLHNIICEPFYAWDSFRYDREQELKYITKKYLNDRSLRQELTPSIRARLVDWLVELQNYFELDHESLYMAVKMADQYLMKKFVPKENFQLLYLTTILISAKFDERLPPITISELIAIAKQKFGIRYTCKQFITFEVDILTTLEFNIRYPLSYGFLRRFAQCTRSDRKTLNLARYILETSLLNYEMIEELESKMAAGSLLLAFEMLHSDGAWDEAARFYTGYGQEELYPLVISLNDFIQSSAKRDSAITRKYSHEFFMKVARIPPLLGLFSSS